MDNIRYRIDAKFSDRVLLPANAIERAFWESNLGDRATFLTSDDIVCSARWESTWNNADGRYDERLDLICRRFWGISFSELRSIWFGRLGEVADYWHLIKLQKK